jgi:hypothetical protein
MIIELCYTVVNKMTWKTCHGGVRSPPGTDARSRPRLEQLTERENAATVLHGQPHPIDSLSTAFCELAGWLEQDDDGSNV